MLGNAVLIASARRALLRIVIGLVAAGVLLTGAFVSYRLREVYAIQLKLTQIESSHRDLMRQCVATQSEISNRFDTIERVLFGDILPKVDAAAAKQPPAMRLEALMLKNERELRARVEALERFRLSMLQ